MEPDVKHDFENEEQFWEALDETVSKPCNTHSDIDDALRSYLTFTSTYSDYVQNEDDIRQCAQNLYFSQLFAQHADYIRRQFVYCLLQEDEAVVLHITAFLLLADARENEEVFALLNDEGTFPRLIEMISTPRQHGEEDLHRQLMELLYEMARVQKITNDDLTCVDDAFICLLFNIIEQVSQDVDDPYHYPVIRVLLVLNEQFMVAAHDPLIAADKSVPLTNKVMKVLSTHGSRFKTFGENIILLLNREDETSLQLLTLKLLYLLFTTPPTYEYFYTNDLHVLVDILIRNLLDLPEEASALRHTYLRVLYPLLEHTQLNSPPHYKQNEVRKLLAVLAGDQIINSPNSPGFSHFDEIDETTRRLVHRCQTVAWIRSTSSEVSEPQSPTTSDPTPQSPTKTKPPALPAPRKLRKRTKSKSSGSSQDFLAPQLESARQSSLSIAELAHQREKPGVTTPSRHLSVKHGLRATILSKKDKPPPPKARKSGLARLKSSPMETSSPDLSESPTMLAASDDQVAENSPQSALGLGIVSEESKQARKPPPAPKARRWRGKKTREPKADNEHAHEEKTSDGGTPIDTQHVVHQDITNPSFLPAEEKTLSPFGNDNGTTSKKTKRMSSVSAALEQAQAQALHDLEKTLEHATIYEETDEKHALPQPSPLRRTVLAPPGQAPRRDVPGPRLEVEQQPSQHSHMDTASISGIAESDDHNEEESEDEWN